ncbi:hypothetical protein EIN_335450 [Entamoeba invadens IP1]|uniref:Protein kinase domain-containing protein n=1 Tax=Entamoeba invadens IP1 TaxID=370355 RepID=L7FLC0_ENTIV|nr:hypothetical protein EIN_335450 [Entamoeba invadens IP1]ELP88563.1 hypothetical protein EIN_335450 [Entamoeba invadens IP1]|eukprot:XP_004255334.1 hypothetical protein EIN_335450 [Entamoeba invadens IP1]
MSISTEQPNSFTTSHYNYEVKHTKCVNDVYNTPFTFCSKIEEQSTEDFPVVFLPYTLSNDLLKPLSARVTLNQSGITTFYLPAISYSLTSAIQSHHLSFATPCKIPQIESYLYDILTLFITTKLPPVTLEDFYIYDERGKYSAFGDVCFWLDVHSPTFTFFITQEKSTKHIDNDFWPKKKEIEKIKQSTVADCLAFIKSFLKACGYRYDTCLRIANFLVELNAATDFYQIKKSDYYNHLHSLKCGDELDLDKLEVLTSDARDYFPVTDLKIVYTEHQQYQKMYFASTPNQRTPKHLGGGAFGQVFQGRYLVDERYLDVAVKFFIVDNTVNNPEHTRDASYYKEMHLLSSLRYEPNVTEIVGKCDEHKIIVQKLYEKNVYNYINGRRNVVFQDVEESRHALMYIADIITSVFNLKEVGVLHRDYKMENTFIKEGRAFIGDFGSGVVLSKTITGLTENVTLANCPPNFFVEKDKRKVDNYTVAIIIANFFFCVNNTTKESQYNFFCHMDNTTATPENNVMNDTYTNLKSNLEKYKTEFLVQEKLIDYVSELKTKLLIVLEEGRFNVKDDGKGTKALSSILDNTKKWLKKLYNVDYVQLDHRIGDTEEDMCNSFEAMYKIEGKKLENHPYAYLLFKEEVEQKRYKEALGVMFYVLQAMVIEGARKKDGTLLDSLWIIIREVCRFVDEKKKKILVDLAESITCVIDSK